MKIYLSEIKDFYKSSLDVNAASLNKEYKPFIVTYSNGLKKQYEFKPELASELGVTRRTIANWLQKKNHGYLKYNIVTIEYL